jgi:methylmalonyl-CoA mutase
MGNYQARAAFTTAFFEPGGFEVLDQGAFETPEAAVQAALDSDAPVVVICSTDEAYPEIVPPLAQAIKAANPAVLVILAGYPEDQIEDHRAAGVDEFVHLRSNCYAANLSVQQRIGVQQ